jgi:predicted DNA-binding transcriptional regulator AlpA
MTELADLLSYLDRPATPDRPIAPTEVPDLMANLARLMAELWLETLTSSAAAPPAPASADRESDYTVKELGKQLQMSESTIYKHWRAGAWPNAYMISKRKGLRIPKRDVEVWKMSKIPDTPTWGAKARPNIRPIRAASLSERPSEHRVTGHGITQDS